MKCKLAKAGSESRLDVRTLGQQVLLHVRVFHANVLRYFHISLQQYYIKIENEKKRHYNERLCGSREVLHHWYFLCTVAWGENVAHSTHD